MRATGQARCIHKVRHAGKLHGCSCSMRLTPTSAVSWGAADKLDADVLTN
jgi:hypothetical protein